MLDNIGLTNQTTPAKLLGIASLIIMAIIVFGDETPYEPENPWLRAKFFDKGKPYKYTPPETVKLLILMPFVNENENSTAKFRLDRDEMKAAYLMALDRIKKEELLTIHNLNLEDISFRNDMCDPNMALGGIFESFYQWLNDEEVSGLK